MDDRLRLLARGGRRPGAQLRLSRSRAGRAAARALQARARRMSRSPSTRLTAVTIPGPAGRLEGLLQEREGAHPAVVALVCHPHPRYGGTMHNKVVHRVASTLHDLGAVVLRFN